MMRFSRRPDSRKSGGYIYIVNSRTLAVLKTLSHLNLTLIRILKSSKVWIIQILNLVTRNLWFFEKNFCSDLSDFLVLTLKSRSNEKLRY
jgi:hypothetical protein